MNFTSYAGFEWDWDDAPRANSVFRSTGITCEPLMLC